MAFRKRSSKKSKKYKKAKIKGMKNKVIEQSFKTVQSNEDLKNLEIIIDQLPDTVQKKI
jgi:hypothetical protein